MQAIVYQRYGPPEVLQLAEVATPRPGKRDILIRTHATTVTSADTRIRSLRMPTGFGLISRLALGITRPRQPVLGSEVAGEVVAVSSDVTRFGVGDPVFAFSDFAMGCHAEFVCLNEAAPIALKPANLTFAEAAALSFGGTTALDFLRRGNLRSGESILINGASGAVGMAAVQIARHFGAKVTGVCSGANAALVESLGASRVIDYTCEDFLQRGESYDVIVDTVGTATYRRSKAALKERGRLLMVLAGLPAMLQIPWVKLTSQHNIIAGPARGRTEDLRFLAELAAAGAYKPVIDRQYPFEQIVEAHRYVDSGHKKGNVVINWRL